LLRGAEHGFEYGSLAVAILRAGSTWLRRGQGGKILRDGKRRCTADGEFIGPVAIKNAAVSANRLDEAMINLRVMVSPLCPRRLTQAERPCFRG
jgi:hypothetical protein